ncbi:MULTISPECIES: NADH:flavin oxidoreductase [Achromobacter]|uniref:NADH:flavin oxidoreductase n=1 Tax=Achromobacter spanius TaxID=217203 RepID=A0ABY8GPW4_9BURK|nr:MULTISPECIES: NADH:flavin oxidoreductase [Achromobacter]WAI83934.1 NADH:flavin oxidoreductase [Achromobacter spanius]WEX94015.1 NADH:flavin oxidoreductase [Achromobacter sp. SS2-2022]WFP06822.1 NADH:flavin oxidoreductase [Achromobacter spanius]
MNTPVDRPVSNTPTAHAGLFAPLRVGTALSLPNRLVVAPMTRVSATADGHATTLMADYYEAFAAGGFGLVITEGIYTDKAYAQGYLFQPGLADDAQRDAWRAVVDRVHGQGGRIVAQLMHAGALSQGNPYRDTAKGPSAVQPRGQQMAFYRGEGPYRMPAAMSADDIAEAIDGFAQAARRAQEAGFDGVEIHGANGYLLDQFLTAHTNVRDDRYGGSLDKRLRLTVDVIQAVRQATSAPFVVGVRASQGKVNDFTHKWEGGEADAAHIFRTLGAQPIDYLHTTEFEAWRPAFGEHGASLAALARQHVSVPVLANGSLHDATQAEGMLARQEADFVSLGRGALTHADWPARLRAGAAHETFDRGLLAPIADLANAIRHRAQRQPSVADAAAG